ncbi:MAG: glycosyltransferase family 4 protein [Actinomycetota bacterium]|nr:glycosyltransferase family 4 protein [Actinomycetota bacterium]
MRSRAAWQTRPEHLRPVNGCPSTPPASGSERRQADARQSLSILYVAEAFGGGLFEITRMMAEQLADMGHRTGIAYGVRPETPADVRGSVDPAVSLIGLPWTERTIRAQVRTRAALKRVCRDWQPDVVHLMSSFAGLHGAVGLGGLPTVYTPQGYSFTRTSECMITRWAYLLLESFVARRVDVIGACSLSEGEHARSLPGVRTVTVVPNGIAELSADVRPPALRSTAPTVVGVGRLSTQRQPEACARMLGAVADRAEVRWIGGGSDTRGLRAMREAGVPVTGWLPRAMTLRSLSESTVYLHWTAWDGLPLSILEAMANDVVVVASDIGPNREVLGPRQVCRTEVDAVRLMRAILADSGLRESLLAEQRERRKWYGADRMAAQWLELYTTLPYSV